MNTSVLEFRTKGSAEPTIIVTKHGRHRRGGSPGIFRTLSPSNRDRRSGCARISACDQLLPDARFRATADRQGRTRDHRLRSSAADRSLDSQADVDAPDVPGQLFAINQTTGGLPGQN